MLVSNLQSDVDRTIDFASIVLHELHLIHTDLKPENILLVHNDYRTVTLPVPGKVGKLLSHALHGRFNTVF
jgi:serine/threonine protein kinase